MQKWGDQIGGLNPTKLVAYLLELCYMDFWLSLPDFGFSNTMLYRTSVFRKVDAKVGGPDWWLKPTKLVAYLLELY